MSFMIKTKLSNRFILIFAFVMSVLSLSSALIAEYGFELKPCELCIAQRVPYLVVIMLSVIGLRYTSWRSGIIIIIGLLFLGESGLASYHFAVEKHWVEGPTACTSAPAPAGQSLDDFLKKIQQAPIVMCDQPAWQFHGITMALLNAIWSLDLAITLFVLRKMVQKHA